MKQHPLSAAWPPMAEAEFRDLVEDIRRRGQRNVAYTYEGMVLDGWNRYLACEEVGETFLCQEWVGTPEDAIAFVLSQNLHRRHISDGQRAAAVVQMHTWRARGERESSDKATADAMAVEAGVSRRTIVAAKAAVANGLGDAVAAGEISVFRAARKDDSGKKKEKQKSELDLAYDKLDAANYAIEELQRRITALEEENAALKLSGAAIPEEVAKLRELIAVLQSQARERMTELVSWKQRSAHFEKLARGR